MKWAIIFGGSNMVISQTRMSTASTSRAVAEATEKSEVHHGKKWGVF